jgi:hypothetical protein
MERMRFLVSHVIVNGLSRNAFVVGIRSTRGRQQGCVVFINIIDEHSIGRIFNTFQTTLTRIATSTGIEICGSGLFWRALRTLSLESTFLGTIEVDKPVREGDSDFVSVSVGDISEASSLISSDVRIPSGYCWMSIRSLG